MLSLLAILLSPLAVAGNHSALDAVLAETLQDNEVRYSALAEDRSALTTYLSGLAQADLSGASRAEKMAVWINAYNATTLNLIASEWPVSSIQLLDEGKVWETRKTRIAGEMVTLNAVEQERLRPLGDARIHAALVCAAKGCPPLALRAYTAQDIDEQLSAASRNWVSTTAVRVDKPGAAVHLSRIFEWYGEDFVPAYGTLHDIPGAEGVQQAALNFVAAYAEPEMASWIRAGGYQVHFIEYDWSINGR